MSWPAYYEDWGIITFDNASLSLCHLLLINVTWSQESDNLMTNTKEPSWWKKNLTVTAIRFMTEVLCLQKHRVEVFIRKSIRHFRMTLLNPRQSWQLNFSTHPIQYFLQEYNDTQKYDISPRPSLFRAIHWICPEDWVSSLGLQKQRVGDTIKSFPLIFCFTSIQKSWEKCQTNPP